MLAAGRGGAQQHAECMNDTPTTSAYNLRYLLRYLLRDLLRYLLRYQLRYSLRYLLRSSFLIVNPGTSNGIDPGATHKHTLRHMVLYYVYAYG